MKLMEVMCKCRECGANVFASDVFKTVVIPKAPNYYALIYKCGACGQANKISSLIEEWEALQDRSEIVEEKNRATIKMAEIMLDQEVDLEYLIAFWNSWPGPPPLERGKYE